MKNNKIFFVAVFLISLIASLNTFAYNASIEKETYLYAVKGKDSLYMDRYFNKHSQQQLNKTQSSPVFIFAFGGGFFTGKRDAKMYLDFYDYLANKGYTVIAIDYRKGLESMYNDSKSAIANGKVPKLKPIEFAKLLSKSINLAVEDLYSATNFILSKSDQWNIDPNKIIISGSSAGAITVLQAEYYRSNNYFGNTLKLENNLPDNFKYAGVIAFAGAILPKSKNITWGDTTAPMLFFHGDADSNVPYDKFTVLTFRFYGSKSIAKSLNKYKIPYYFHTEENSTHTVAVSPIDKNRNLIDYFLDTYINNQNKIMEENIIYHIGQNPRNKNFKLKDYIISNFK